MDSYSRMGLAAHRMIVADHAAELRREASEARFLAVDTLDTDPRPIIGRSLRRRIAAVLERGLAHVPSTHAARR
jgi:hypothetical protein